MVDGQNAHPDLVRVAVVDDHATYAELLALALAHEPGFECVGTATSAVDGEKLVAETFPDVVIMDVQLGDEDGIELTGKLTALQPALRVVVLTARTDRELVQRAAGAGACALLPKDGSLEDVLHALRTARQGGLAVHPTMLMSMVSATIPQQRQLPRLTEREREVLSCLRDGLTVRAIAHRLSISEHTCRGHVKRLLVKLDAHSQLEAVALATKSGLLE